jgi:hypothetical protein
MVNYLIHVMDPMRLENGLEEEEDVIWDKNTINL